MGHPRLFQACTNGTQPHSAQPPSTQGLRVTRRSGSWDAICGDCDSDGPLGGGAGRWGREMALLPATSTGSTRSRDGNLDDFVYGYQEAAHDEKSSLFPFPKNRGAS